MEVVKAIVLLLIGFILLVKFSDIFVDAISSVASHFKMSKMMIALTIGAFGTCAPELAISFTSLAKGSSDITLANTVGSCIVNIFLIIGIAAMIKPVKVKEETTTKELPLLLIITSVFTVFLNDSLFSSNIPNGLSRIEGVTLLLFFAYFIYHIVTLVKTSKTKKEKAQKAKYTLARSIVYIVITLLIIIVSSDLIVDNAVLLATSLGVSEKIISMTILVIGSSLPELSLTIACARKGEYEMVLGNIIGTNIFNICVVLVLPILVYGGLTTNTFDIIDSVMLISSALALYIFGKTNKEISKIEGIILFVILGIYYAYLFLV